MPTERVGKRKDSPTIRKASDWPTSSNTKPNFAVMDSLIRLLRICFRSRATSARNSSAVAGQTWLVVTPKALAASGAVSHDILSFSAVLFLTTF